MMRIMAMGDSNTDGWTDYSNTSHGGYRIKLDQKLEAAGIKADFVGSQRSGPFTDNEHEGYSGKTIDWLVSKAHSAVPAYNPDVILLMAGNNDLKTDSVATMKSDMSKLLDTVSHDAPNAVVLVATLPPPRPGNLSGQSTAVAAEFNKALPGLVASKAAAGVKVSLVDTTTTLSVNDMSPIGPDRGTHLSAQGYEKLANLWFDAIKKIDGGNLGEAPRPDHPVAANNDSASTGKGEAITIKVLQNDTAIDGGLKISNADDISAKGGKVVVNTDGTITYTPKAGYTGADSFKYTAKDADGDHDGATVAINVHAPSAPPSSGGGTGNPVIAGNDAYKVDAGEKLYFAAKYLLLNDKGKDGGLKITSIDSKSEHGFTVVQQDSGAIVYKADAGFSGTDRVDYVLTDKDGSTDTGTVIFTVKGDGSAGNSTPPASNHDNDPTPPPSSGKGNPVVAMDDNYKVDGGKMLYFNTGYVTWNDKGLDGGLNVISVDAVSDRGVTISWGPEGSKADGTLIYKAPTGFEGTDKINYTVTDKDGSHDIGTVFIHVHDLFA